MLFRSIVELKAGVDGAGSFAHQVNDILRRFTKIHEVGWREQTASSLYPARLTLDWIFRHAISVFALQSYHQGDQSTGRGAHDAKPLAVNPERGPMMAHEAYRSPDVLHEILHLKEGELPCTTANTLYPRARTAEMRFSKLG